MFYRMELYDGLERVYAGNAEFLTGELSFLFEYGHILNKTGKYKESNSILFQGSKLSSDPMFHNIIGNNYKELEEYDLAAESYRKAFSILPNRLYPLYLSAKLYLESNDTLNAISYARQAIEFIPKVESPATRDMKKEMNDILHVKLSRD